jgi:hypothetical protein
MYAQLADVMNSLCCSEGQVHCIVVMTPYAVLQQLRLRTIVIASQPDVGSQPTGHNNQQQQALHPRCWQATVSIPDCK